MGRLVLGSYRASHHCFLPYARLKCKTLKQSVLDVMIGMQAGVGREMQKEVWDDGRSRHQCGEQADGKVCFIVKFVVAPSRTT